MFSNLRFPFLSVIFLFIPYLTRLLSTQVTYHLTSLIFFVQRTACTRSGFTPSLCLSPTGFYQFVFTASFRAVWLSLLSPFFARLMLSGTGRFYFLHPYSRLAPYRSCRYHRRGVYRLSWHVCLTRCCLMTSSESLRVSVSFLLLFESVLVSASAVPLLHTFCSPSALLLLFISGVRASESRYRTHYFARGRCISS